MGAKQSSTMRPIPDPEVAEVQKVTEALVKKVQDAADKTDGKPSLELLSCSVQGLRDMNDAIYKFISKASDRTKAAMKDILINYLACSADCSILSNELFSLSKSVERYHRNTEDLLSEADARIARESRSDSNLIKELQATFKGYDGATLAEPSKVIDKLQELSQKLQDLLGQCNAVQSQLDGDAKQAQAWGIVSAVVAGAGLVGLIVVIAVAAIPTLGGSLVAGATFATGVGLGIGAVTVSAAAAAGSAALFILENQIRGDLEKVQTMKLETGIVLVEVSEVAILVNNLLEDMKDVDEKAEQIGGKRGPTTFCKMTITKRVKDLHKMMDTLRKQNIHLAQSVKEFQKSTKESTDRFIAFLMRG